MHTERVTILSSFLRRQVVKEEFDMRTYITKIKQGKPHIPGCGTAACAGAWACMIPEFQKAGLHLRPSKISQDLIPALRDLIGLDALEAFFGLKGNQVARVFESHAGMTPTEFADYLDSLLAIERGP
jgi:hypothetical protein